MKTRMIFTIIVFNLIFFNTSAQDTAGYNNQLLFAVQALNIEKARQAIRNGANVNAIDDDGWPLFISAVNSDNEGMINLFLRSGVKVDVTGPDGKAVTTYSEGTKT
ncbi:MAG TPA: hypothetical protein PL056_01990, partial [bacterium]|nr:hypothetical protein [bacterium]